MKKLFLALYSLFLISSPLVSYSHAKETPKQNYNKLKTLNLSSSSKHSYEAAMTAFHLKKPDGYAISSIRYVRNGGLFIVLVELIRVN